jgi:hypothetical protein
MKFAVESLGLLEGTNVHLEAVFKASRAQSIRQNGVGTASPLTVPTPHQPSILPA